MPKLVVRPLDKGFRNDRLAFNIDNDSFPTLLNAYQWRGRVKRKRGTSSLTRLARQINSSSIQTDGLGGFAGNILAGLESTASVVLNSIIIGAETFTDTSPPTGVLTGSIAGTGTINYSTGALTITGATPATNIRFQYYPDLPVMGLRDLNLTALDFPGTLGFDTKYSYSINSSAPYNSTDVSYYKNPTTGTYPSYVQKTVDTPTTWNGQNYQQFWTVNYEGALWAVNGLKSSTDLSSVGMQFLPASGITSATQTSATTVDFVIPSTPLVVGDFVFANEFTGVSGSTINFQTGYVINIVATTYTVKFPYSNIGAAGLTPGILQYLTTRSDNTIDCIRWYDGDPTTTTNGWVNFAPPLSQALFSIGDEVASQYYLVGAVMMLPFKDRLLFFGPVIENSSGTKFYLQDTVIYSENGTPYYTCGFTGSPASSATVFSPILTPTGQSATAASWFEDSTGFGGFISAGFSQPILTASTNEDVLIVGFSNRQTRFVYTGNDIVPFNFFVINSEYGSTATFSSITLDRGVITIGNNGIVLTAQIGSQRIDLEIPDQLFEFNITANGFPRVCSQRDFINEWIYFTYPSDQYSSYPNGDPYVFPTQTLLYNYREGSWAVFNESYTTYGAFRKQTGDTWETLTLPLTWSSWDTPWEAGDSNLLQPDVIAGNSQGFVLVRDQKTSEAPSLSIANISGNTITSYNHCLNIGDYIIISGVVGNITPSINGNVYQVLTATQNTINVGITFSGTYKGLGVIQRLYIPTIMTKQFPLGWEDARKVRIGVQQYLLTTTANAQITLLIFLSTDNENPYNSGPIVPSNSSINNSLVYSNILYTCPESTNLGLTPANSNLQMIVNPNEGFSPQQQIWHRINTSLIGDTVQLGFTLSPEQMTTVDSNGKPISQFAEIELHGFILDINPSQLLA